jgi:hypothetical protein
MIASVAMVFAFSNARSFAAGMYKADRRGRSELIRILCEEVSYK